MKIESDGLLLGFPSLPPARAGRRSRSQPPQSDKRVCFDNGCAEMKTPFILDPTYSPPPSPHRILDTPPGSYMRDLFTPHFYHKYFRRIQIFMLY